MFSLPVSLRTNRALLFAVGLFVAIFAGWMMTDRPVKAEKRLAERIAAGKSVPYHFYVPIYLWRGLTLDIALSALLVGAAALAGRKLSSVDVPQEGQTSPVGRIVVAACMVVAALEAGSRLGLSTWGDEDYTVKNYISDQLIEEGDGVYKMEPASWSSLMWFYKRPNNHIGYTAVARVVHELFFKPGTGPTDPIFSEVLVRLPAYAFGLLSILTLAWMARVWGWTSGLWIVLPFYVTHPWLVRFASDTRGYCVVLFGLPLLFAIIHRAVTTGAWRWWLLLALTQGYVFWAYWGVVYVLAPLHGAVLLLCLTDSSRTMTERWTQVGRWAFSCLLPGLVLAVIMAPLLPQFLDFMLHNKQISGGMDAAWWRDAWSQLFFGTPWHPWSADAPLCVSISQMGMATKVSALINSILLAGTAILGAALMWKDQRQRWLLLPILGAPVLFFTHMTLTGMRPYHWYLTLFFPGFLALLMSGFSPAIEMVVRFFKERASIKTMPTGALVSAFLVMSVGAAITISTPQRQTLQKHAFEPCRESVALTRKVTNPRHPDFGKDSITAGFTMFTEAYDPAMVRFQTLEELIALMSKAQSTGRDLFVNFSSRAFCMEHYPDLFKLFDDPTKFEHVAVLPGQFDAATREVVKMKR